jgi:hypothetical protein
MGTAKAPGGDMEVSTMQHAEVATGVRRLGDDHVNWYLVEDGQKITVVDAGIPARWWQLESALRSRGIEPSDVSALLLAQAHAQRRRIRRPSSWLLWRNVATVRVSDCRLTTIYGVGKPSPSGLCLARRSGPASRTFRVKADRSSDE